MNKLIFYIYLTDKFRIIIKAHDIACASIVVRRPAFLAGRHACPGDQTPLRLLRRTRLDRNRNDGAGA
jgi:hypothetical protein